MVGPAPPAAPRALVAELLSALPLRSPLPPPLPPPTLPPKPQLLSRPISSPHALRCWRLREATPAAAKAKARSASCARTCLSRANLRAPSRPANARSALACCSNMFTARLAVAARAARLAG